MSENNASAAVDYYAVLIGISHYSAFDRGTLRAPKGDLLGWFDVVDRLGVPRENIQVCTDSTYERGAFGPVPPKFRAADTRGVRNAMNKLVQACRASTDAGRRAVAIVSFAGHGELDSEQDAGLYLSDFDGERDDLDMATDIAVRGQLSLYNLSRKLGAATDLVMLVDTCRERPKGSQMANADRPFGDRPHLMVLSTGHGQLAYERVYLGQWRSQFALAANLVLGEWTVGYADGVRAFTLTWSTFRDRINALIRDLGRADQPQRVELAGRQDLQGLPIGAPSGRGQAVKTYTEPQMVADRFEFPADTPGHVIDSYGDPIGLWKTVGTSSVFFYFTGQDHGMFNTTPEVTSCSTKHVNWQNLPQSYTRYHLVNLAADPVINTTLPVPSAAMLVYTGAAGAVGTRCVVYDINNATITWYRKGSHTDLGSAHLPWFMYEGTALQLDGTWTKWEDSVAIGTYPPPQ